MHDSKEIVQFKCKVNWNFYYMVEIQLIMINEYEYFYHIWIFTLKSHKSFTDNLPKQI